jgi:hypothetical protein
MRPSSGALLYETLRERVRSFYEEQVEEEEEEEEVRI